MIETRSPLITLKSRFSPLLAVSVQFGEPLVMVVVVSVAGAATLYTFGLPTLSAAKDQTLPSPRRYLRYPSLVKKIRCSSLLDRQQGQKKKARILCVADNLLFHIREPARHPHKPETLMSDSRMYV